MTRPALVLLLVSAAACKDGEPPPAVIVPVPDAAPVGEITLPPDRPRAGDVIELDAETSISAKVRLYRNGTFGGFLTLGVRHARMTRAEVQEGGTVRLRYVKDRMTDVATGAERALPVEGKTYRFDASGVTMDDGSAAPDAEDEIVRADAAAVIAVSPLAEVISGHALTLGEQRDLRERTLPAVSRGGELTRLTWLYKGKRNGQAIIAWTGALHDRWANGLVVRANLVGEVTVEPATGRVVETTSDGPATIEVPVSDRGKPGVYQGNGRMTVRVTRRPLPAVAP